MCTIDEKAAVHSADHAGADAPHTHAHTHEHGHDHGHTHEHHSPEETVALLSYSSATVSSGEWCSCVCP